MKRDIRIDILRALAIILIILAHTAPPTWLVQARVFDVPLMAMLLGMSFVLSSKKTKDINYMQFITKRFKRLVVPAWVFLTLFFICAFIFSFLVRSEIPFGFTTIFSSYLLLSGIGYVWIIRVFFTIAIFSPLILRISKRIHSINLKLVTLASLLVIQHLLCLFTEQLNGKIKFLFQELISISFGYMIVALIGMWAVQQIKKKNLVVSLYSLVIFIAIALVTNFPLISKQKYPPTVYFITYGIGISLLLFYLLSNNKIQEILNKRGVFWLSKHSLEIYYWHIFPIMFFQVVAPGIVWWLKFLIILVTSIIVTIVQTRYLPGFFNLNFKRPK